LYPKTSALSVSTTLIDAIAFVESKANAFYLTYVGSKNISLTGEIGAEYAGF
jgi:hypothetical protein